MFYLFFLGVISRIASSASIAINTKGISITNNGPLGLASKVFNESDLVITRDLNGTTHPHLSQSIGIVISSNLQTTELKLVQTENDTYHNVYLSVMIPTNKLRKLNYISDPYAFQNRNKVFVSATLQPLIGDDGTREILSEGFGTLNTQIRVLKCTDLSGDFLNTNSPHQ
eukprot:137571_1